MNEEIITKLFELAKLSLKEDDFPVGAIVYDETGILGCGYNKRHKSNKTTDHAEIIAIEEANKKVKNWNLQNKCMVVTLEPCEMCKSVIKEARIKKVYYLTPRLKFKKQYKCTDIEYYELKDARLEQYKKDITQFFSNKR